VRAILVAVNFNLEPTSGEDLRAFIHKCKFRAAEVEGFVVVGHLADVGGLLDTSQDHVGAVM
jgi:hypothetical protein